MECFRHLFKVLHRYTNHRLRKKQLGFGRVERIPKGLKGVASFITTDEQLQ